MNWVNKNANCVPRGNTSKLSMHLVLFVELENTKNQTINQVQVVKSVAKVLTKMKKAVHFVSFVPRVGIARLVHSVPTTVERVQSAQLACF